MGTAIRIETNNAAEAVVRATKLREKTASGMRTPLDIGQRAISGKNILSYALQEQGEGQIQRKTAGIGFSLASFNHAGNYASTARILETLTDRSR